MTRYQDSSDLKKKSLKWLAVVLFLIQSHANFLDGRIKVKLTGLRFRFHIPASRQHSKCDKICDTDTTRRRGKALIFRQTALSLYTADSFYINVLP